MDESYFGGNRGHGAAGKIPVFGLLKRDGKIYTRVIPTYQHAAMRWISARSNTPASIIPNSSPKVETTSTGSRISENEPCAPWVQAPHAQIQGCPEGAFRAICEGARMALQHT